MDSYREALGLDPTQETTRGRLEALTVAMEAKVCWLLAGKSTAHSLTFLSSSLSASLPHVYTSCRTDVARLSILFPCLWLWTPSTDTMAARVLYGVEISLHCAWL